MARAVDGWRRRERQWHRKEADIARQRMREGMQGLHDLDEFIDDVDGLLGGFEKGQPLDRAKARRLLALRGLADDADATDAVLLAALKQEKDRAIRERQEKALQFDRDAADARHHEEVEAEDRRKAAELAAKRDAILSRHCGAAEEARLLHDLAGEYQLDVRAKAAVMENPDGLSRQAIRDSIDASQDKGKAADFMAMTEKLVTKPPTR